MKRDVNSMSLECTEKKKRRKNGKIKVKCITNIAIKASFVCYVKFYQSDSITHGSSTIIVEPRIVVN